MKIKIIVLIVIGVVVFSGTGYLYSQMYDCLHPPLWMKIPRQYSIGDCLQMYSEGILPDYTKAREDYATKQARNTELIGRFDDMPEVKAFYAKYEDANVSVREDHISYFAGNEVDFRVRMNLYLDENDELDHIDLHCYVEREHQTEVADHFILRYLKDYDCKK